MNRTDGLFVLDAACKSGLLFAGGLLSARLLRTASAAVRHRFWTILFGGLVLLPLLCLSLPKWKLALWTRSVPIIAVPLAGKKELTSPLQTTIPAAHHAIPFGIFPKAAVREKQIPSFSTTLPSVPTVYSAALFPAGFPVFAGLIALWGVGAICALIPLVRGGSRVRRLQAQSAVQTESRLSDILRQAQQQTGRARPVRLLQGKETGSPLGWGVLRPALWLPAGAENWTDDRLRIVFLHELAHFARQDWLLQTVVRLLCAVYWFHPGVWYAARQIRQESENACDDRVLNLGITPSAYADTLLEIAKTMQKLRIPTAAVAMASLPRLENRIRTILDSSRNRRTGTTRTVLVTGAAVLALTITLATVRVGAKGVPVPQASSSEKALAEKRAAESAVASASAKQAAAVSSVQKSEASKRSAELLRKKIAEYNAALAVHKKALAEEEKRFQEAKTDSERAKIKAELAEKHEEMARYHAATARLQQRLAHAEGPAEHLAVMLQGRHAQDKDREILELRRRIEKLEAELAHTRQAKTQKELAAEKHRQIAVRSQKEAERMRVLAMQEQLHRELEEQRQQVEISQQELNKAKSLRDAGVATDDTFREKQAQHEKARLQLQQVEEKLRQMEQALFSGQLKKAEWSEGQQIRAKIEELEIERVLAQSQLESTESRWKAGLIARPELDAANERLRTLENSILRLKKRLDERESKPLKR